MGMRKSTVDMETGTSVKFICMLTYHNNFFAVLNIFPQEVVDLPSAWHSSLRHLWSTLKIIN